MSTRRAGAWRLPRPHRTPPPAHVIGDGGIRDAAIGFGCLGRGLVHVARRPRLLLLGAAPALVASVLLVGAVGLVAWGSGPLAAALTPGAAAWHPMVADIVRTLLSAMVVIAGALLAVLLFVSVTMAVGAPFHDAISQTVDRACGDPAPVADVGRAESVRRGVVDAVQGFGFAALVALAGFATSLVPVLGQLAAPVVGAVLGGWLLTLELLQPAFERRGLGRLRDRRAWVARFRGVVLGFGVPVYLCLLVPVLGVVVFPGAVAGATLLARAIRGEESVPRDQR